MTARPRCRPPSCCCCSSCWPCFRCFYCGGRDDPDSGEQAEGRATSKRHRGPDARTEARSWGRCGRGQLKLTLGQSVTLSLVMCGGHRGPRHPCQRSGSQSLQRGRKSAMVRASSASRRHVRTVVGGAPPPLPVVYRTWRGRRGIENVPFFHLHLRP